MSADADQAAPLTLSQRARELAVDIEAHINTDRMFRSVTTGVLLKRDQRIADLREIIQDLLDSPTATQSFINAKKAARNLLEQSDD